MKAFAKAKDIYEACNIKAANFKTMIDTYAKAVMQLEQSLALIDSNMAKAKLTVDTLSSKKTMLDTVKTVNKSIENLNGTGETELSVNVEKLDDDMLRESVKLDALSSTDKPSTQMTEADAKAHLDSSKS